jgi:replicative DNA helicase
MLGDGNMTGGVPRFTNANPAVREDFIEAAGEFGGLGVREETSAGTRTPTVCVYADRVVVRGHQQTFARTLRRAILESRRPAREIAARAVVSPASLTHWSQGRTVPDVATTLRLHEALAEGPVELDISDLDRARKNTPNGLRRWLEELGLWGRAAKDKILPDAVFRAPREELVLFLNRLFATDGWATVLASGQAQVGYSTVSEKLARQVQHLLLRFGVIAALCERSVKYDGARRQAFQLNITESGSIRAFIEGIGIFGKETAVGRVARVLDGRRHANRDLIPREAWRLINEARGGESWASLSRRMGFGPGHNLHVGTRAVSRDRMSRFAEVLEDQRLRDLAESDVYWDRIVSIEPLGMEQVYDLTIPGTHNFVANDVCVHNTAMALNAIWHASGEKKMPVAIFSLEMSKEQLVQRLISQTTRIPAQALRSGNVKAEDWPKLVRGVAEVSRAPIWIDDTAGVTLMEIRAKVRRLASQLNVAGELPLSLVVVDYLQLMVGQGNRAENRQQEIAEISRGLKVLARDLDVPVLAIAQLSRAVEARHDKRPLLSDLRDCVTGDTLVLLADGRRIPVRKLVGTRPRVLAMSPAGKVVEAESDCVWSVGPRPVFTVRLASGREVRATATHRLFGADGWIRVGELRPGDRLAIARDTPEPENALAWPGARLALLGHLIGDGSYLSGQPLRYCTASEENSRLVAQAAGEEFGVTVNRHAGRGNWHQLVLSGNGNRWHPAGVNLWLRELGIFGQRSYEKRIPESVFGLDDASIAVLLKHLWATDGTIFARKPGTRGSSTICFSTNSRGLAHDVAALLLRLGIVARIREVSQGEHRPMFTVSISGARDQTLFLESVGAFGPRRGGAEKLARLLATRRAGTNVDTLPIEFFEKVKASMAARSVSHRAMSLARGTSYGGSSRFRFAPSRALMAEYAGLLEDETLLADAESALFWDSVIEVVPDGEKDVYDLTVPGPASWLADGIVSHNSGAIEQDADVVMFLYRDEYYNPESDDKGIAEVIVGKHRNGPTGKVQLAWMEQYTKFGSLARRV